MSLKKLNENEFESWLFSFIEKELGTEADMIFIYLFQEGSMFSNADTLSERIAIYLSEKPEKKKYLKEMLGELLSFLVEKGALDETSCLEEAKRISDILKGDLMLSSNTAGNDLLRA